MSLRGLLFHAGLILGMGIMLINGVFAKPESSNRNPQEKCSENMEKSPKDGICYTPGCVHTASYILGNMDQSVDPCDDFYKFACGTFTQKTNIPDGQTTVNPYNIIRENVKQQLRTSLEKKMTPADLRAFQLVKILYNDCMNESMIEERGLSPIKEILDDLGGWPVLLGDQWNEDNFSWEKSAYEFRKKGYSFNHFIDFHIDTDLKNSSKRTIVVDQALLGLEQEYLTKGEDDKVVRAYLKYMTDVAVTLGANKERANEEMLESLKFEIELARISLPEEKRRNTTAKYNPMTVQELADKYKLVPWLEYFNTLMAPVVRIEENESVVVYLPSYISDLEKLLRRTSKRVQANYAMWRVIKRSVSYLNDEIRKRELAFYAIYKGMTKREPRWKECTNIASTMLPQSIGSIYARNHFNKDAKKSAEKMVSYVRGEFKKTLQNVDWMDEDTRKAALDKAESIIAHIAYPDELLDDTKIEEYYKKLNLVRDNYFQNILNIGIFKADSSFDKLRKPVNKSDWAEHGKSAVVNAFYEPSENSIEFPAGVLQEPFFSYNRPNYLNYGTIGFTIGHEITHGFDNYGSQYDNDGNTREWWSKTTRQEFLRRVQCIIEQASNYNVSGTSLKINGINTQGENTADNGGMKMAYLAYNEWESHNGIEPRLPGLQNYTSQQMFWISAAQKWCTVYKIEKLINQITTDEHSPSEFRINGPMSNIPMFAKDFECSATSKMNPTNKCIVW